MQWGAFRKKSKFKNSYISCVVLILNEIFEAKIESTLVHAILRIPNSNKFFMLLSGKLSDSFHSNYKL